MARRGSLQIIPIRNNAQRNWAELSSNPAPDVIELLIANPHMINWPNLSGNPGAIELLIANPHRIDYNRFRNNPGVRAGDDRFIRLLTRLELEISRNRTNGNRTNGNRTNGNRTNRNRTNNV